MSLTTRSGCWETSMHYHKLFHIGLHFLQRDKLICPLFSEVPPAALGDALPLGPRIVYSLKRTNLPVFADAAWCGEGICLQLVLISAALPSPPPGRAGVDQFPDTAGCFLAVSQFCPRIQPSWLADLFQCLLLSYLSYLSAAPAFFILESNPLLPFGDYWIGKLNT